MNIVITEGISSLISCVATNGNVLNDGYNSINNEFDSELIAANQYIKEEEDIKELFDLYIKLVEKDTMEMREMIINFEIADVLLGAGLSCKGNSINVDK